MVWKLESSGHTGGKFTTGTDITPVISESDWVGNIVACIIAASPGAGVELNDNFSEGVLGRIRVQPMFIISHRAIKRLHYMRKKKGVTYL